MAETPLDAYWNFFTTFNSQDARRFSQALHYPHVRISPRRTPVVVPTVDDHAANIGWQTFIDSGWDHTVGAEPTVIHESDDRAHIAGGWTRYDGNETPILTNHVTYVVTKGASGWGIQSRFGIDGDLGGSHADAAITLVEDYIDAYNDRDWAACAKCMHFPTFKVDVAQVRSWDSAEAIVDALAEGPWHFVTEKAVSVVQSGEHAVTVAVEIVLDGGDQPEEALFFVTQEGDEGWGIQARSIIDL